MKIEFFADYPADIEAERFAALTRGLHAASDTVGAAVFGGASELPTGAICFCGVNERFRSLSLLRDMSIPCAVVQDLVRPWFTGSAVCPTLPDLIAELQGHMSHIRRWLVFGQSSGGYAALHASRLLPASLAVAFSPQTFDDRVMQGRIGHPLAFRKSFVQEPIMDLAELFANSPLQNPALVVSSINETENPVESFFWLDHMHWARIAHIPSVRIFLLGTQNHSLLYRKGAFFASVLADLARQDSFGLDKASGWLAHRLYHSA